MLIPEPETKLVTYPTPKPEYMPSSHFLMSEDNYRFNNSRASFGYSNDYKITLELYQISFLLDDVWKECAKHKNVFSALLNAMDNTGLIIYLNVGNFVYAVVAYGVSEISQGVYELDIYDNNYPLDKNRKMRIDTNSGVWSYKSEKYGINCGSQTTHYFSYIPAGVVDLAVDTALKTKVTVSMKVIIPNTAEINGEKIEIPETEKGTTTSLWAIENGKNEVNFNSGGGSATFFDDETSLTVKTEESNLIININGGEITVSENKGNIEIDYITNKTVDKPLEIDGEGNIGIKVAEGHLVVFGDGKLEISL